MSDFNMQSYNRPGDDHKTDLVCGMKVDPVKPPFQARYKGEMYYFCSKACKHLFEREPEKYIRFSK